MTARRNGGGRLRRHQCGAAASRHGKTQRKWRRGGAENKARSAGNGGENQSAVKASGGAAAYGAGSSTWRQRGAHRGINAARIVRRGWRAA